MAETVAAREGKIQGACLEITAVNNDWRARAVGGLESALFLSESLCVPSLLHGAGTLKEISTETKKQAESNSVVVPSLSSTDWTQFTQGFPLVGFQNVRL